MARRTRVVVLVTAGLGIVAAASTGYWYTHTPSFALKQLAKAIAAHDTIAAHDYLDLQATATQVVNAVVESATAKVMMNAANESNGFAAIGAALGASMIEKMKPAMVLVLKAGLDSAIATPDTRYLAPANTQNNSGTGSGATPAAIRNIMGPVADRELTLDHIGATHKYGDSAVVDLFLHHASFDTTLILAVAMRRATGPWRVVGIANAGAYLKSIETVEAKRLASKNAPIQARLTAMAPSGKLEVEHQTVGYFSEYLRLRAAVRNDSRDTIVALFFALDGPKIETTDGTVGLLYTEDEGPITPGVTVAIEGIVKYNPFMNGQTTLRESPEQFAPRLMFAVIRHGAKRDTITPYASWLDYQKRHVVANAK